MKQYNLVLGLCIAFLGWTSCDLDDPDLGVAAADVITLSATDTDLVANGETSVVLTAELGRASEPNLAITFTTTSGTFLEADDSDTYTVAASGRTATATLVSATEVNENVVVTATVDAPNGGNSLPFKATRNLKFTRAFPENMIFSSDKLFVTNNGFDGANLCVQLFRNIGMVSANMQVNFEAIMLDSAMVSLVPFSFTDDNAKATNIVRSANLKKGQVAIVAEVLQENGMFLRDTLEINIVD